ncbi:MAG: hypothetical protein WAN36_01445 [Calditrichia bacterium]
MTYKIRNIMVLAAFCGLVGLVGGFFIFYYYPGKIKKLNTEIENTQKQIAALDGIEEQFLQLEEVIRTQEQRLESLDKRVLAEVSPAATYKYLNTILNYSGTLDFNLYYSGGKKDKGFSYNVYRVKGEGSFQNIYRFLSYLDYGPEFYRINKLSMRLMESKDGITGRYQVTVPFEIELWALFSEVKNLPEIKRTLNDVKIENVSNPFYPLIQRNIPTNTRNLLEVERAELKAVLPDKAMIADNNGEIHVLRVGDEVYLGYLKSIDHANNRVEFVLNKGGIVETYALDLSFDKQIR